LTIEQTTGLVQADDAFSAVAETNRNSIFQVIWLRKRDFASLPHITQSARWPWPASGGRRLCRLLTVQLDVVRKTGPDTAICDLSA
jgi:hypothetical protein